MSMIHGELSEIDAILTTPNLEVMKILNGGLLWRKHQDYIFLIIFSNHHCHMGICPEIEIRTCLLCCSDGLDTLNLKSYIFCQYCLVFLMIFWSIKSYEGDENLWKIIKYDKKGAKMMISHELINLIFKPIFGE